MIAIEKVNDVYIKIRTDRGIEQEIYEHFSFLVPNYKYMPAYKRGWDGYCRLFNKRTKQLYAGLLDQVKSFAKDREYEITIDDRLDTQTELSIHGANKFISTLNLPFDVRDYQLDAFVHAIRSNRTALLSPTGSGKSLIIYLILRYLHDILSCNKILVIVPTISLVNQLTSDFTDYGFDTDSTCHKIFSGEEKYTDRLVTVSTWQSLHRLPEEYFRQFDVVIGDEVHLFKSDSLVKIMTNLTDCPYRFGLTGTLDGSLTNKMIIEGLFGPVLQVTTTKKLIDEKYLASFKVKAINLKYSDDDRKLITSLNDYQQEVDWIVTNPKRNNFIKNLVLSLDGNSLVMFQFVEKHGKILLDLISNSTDRPVHFVSGEVEGEERERIRNIVETQHNAIIIASNGVFSTGINIKNLNNIIFTSPSKSRIRTLQSIGRVLRRSETKTSAILFDIADDLSWKKKINYTLRHFAERLKIYNQEQFTYKIYNVEIKK